MKLPSFPGQLDYKSKNLCEYVDVFGFVSLILGMFAGKSV